MIRDDLEIIRHHLSLDATDSAREEITKAVEGLDEWMTGIEGRLRYLEKLPTGIEHGPLK